MVNNASGQKRVWRYIHDTYVDHCNAWYRNWCEVREMPATDNQLAQLQDDNSLVITGKPHLLM